MEEAFASAPPSVDLIDTLELTHPLLASPIRIVTGTTSNLFARLTAGGNLATFVPCEFSYTPPSQSESGIEPAEISIDGVGNILIEALDSLIPGGVPIDVVYRQYRSDDLDNPGEIWSGFQVKNIRTNGITTSAELVFPDVSVIAFPRAIYDQETYPGIHAGAAT